jgi:predicted O-linked N-acetylglucosamine transferase (SPINDLY family)
VLRLSDVYLDSIGWSGGNTTLESLEHDLPVVTMAGPLMRGRHTMAILQQMGLDHAVTGSLDGYLNLAVCLGKDAELRATMRAEIAERKERVYRDATPIRALEVFLERVARG